MSDLALDDEKKKDQETVIHKEALDHAWSWFKYHAEQRISMIRFYIVALGGIATGIGLLHQREQHFLCAVLSLFAAMMAYCFLLIDQRTRDLVRLGESALKSEQSRMAIATGDDALNICREADVKRRSHLYTYGQIFRFIFYATIALFIVMAIFSLSNSRHVLMMIHRYFC